MKINRNKKGFTLIELLIVIVIIAILAAVGIPVYANNVNRALVSVAKGNLGILVRANAVHATMTGANHADQATGTPFVFTYNITPTVTDTITLGDAQFQYSVASATGVLATNVTTSGNTVAESWLGVFSCGGAYTC